MANVQQTAAHEEAKKILQHTQIIGESLEEVRVVFKCPASTSFEFCDQFLPKIDTLSNKVFLRHSLFKMTALAE